MGGNEHSKTIWTCFWQRGCMSKKEHSKDIEGYLENDIQWKECSQSMQGRNEISQNFSLFSSLAFKTLSCMFEFASPTFVPFPLWFFKFFHFLKLWILSNSHRPKRSKIFEIKKIPYPHMIEGKEINLSAN